MECDIYVVISDTDIIYSVSGQKINSQFFKVKITLTIDVMICNKFLN